MSVGVSASTALVMMVGAMQLVLDAFEIRSTSALPEVCESTIDNAGGCALAISSALPAHGTVLNSVYLADFSAGPLAVSYLLTAPGRLGELWQRIIEDGPMGAGLMRACLLDHAAVLRDSLERLWAGAVSVQVSDLALEEAARFWMTTPSDRA